MSLNGIQISRLVSSINRELEDDEKCPLVDRTRQQLLEVYAALRQISKLDGVISVAHVQVSGGKQKTRFARSVHRSKDGKKFFVATRNERTSDSTRTAVIRSCKSQIPLR